MTYLVISLFATEHPETLITLLDYTIVLQCHKMLKTRFSDPVIIIPRVLLEENHNHFWKELSQGGAAASYALP